MSESGTMPSNEMPLGSDATVEQKEYASQSEILQEFSSISNIDKAWILKPNDGNSSLAMFSVSQPDILADKNRTYILSSHISKNSNNKVNLQWGPFPVEMSGVSTVVPSPSGLKMLVVRNQENGSPTKLEFWGTSRLEKEIHVPKSVHGSVYTDGWFEGISWNSNETVIAYVAEEPSLSKPAFDVLNRGTWKGQGDWEENWGETYVGKRQPALFVVNILSEEVHAVKGISRSISVGQIVWAPVTNGVHQYIVFVGWSHENGRKLGLKHCQNRRCALYAVRAPIHKIDADTLEPKGEVEEEFDAVVNLTQSISSAYFPRFSPDGQYLVFLSSKNAVDTGAHSATDSLHRIDWGTYPSTKIIDVVPVVMFAEEGSFPGLYCSSFLSKPWLSDGSTMVLSSYWGSTQVLLSVNVLSGELSRISSGDTSFSWNVLALDGNHILAVCSSPINPPQIKYGCPIEVNASGGWCWQDASTPIARYSEKVRSLLASLKFDVLKIPVRGSSEKLTKGAKIPYEAIFVSKSRKTGVCDPLIVFLHGGPHTVALTSFSKYLAFLASLGYSLLIVNYRGSLGFGEEALQSLPGKIGSQDVNDVLAAVDHITEMGLADPSRVAVFGGLHGGFLTTHLIGQAPHRFVAAVAKNPVCDLALMAATTDIPDWCYVEAFGTEGRSYYKDAPSLEQLNVLHNKSPISHISKVKTPTLFLLGSQDVRVSASNGLQYARALKEKGVEVKVIVFPNNFVDRPQIEFESFLNIGLWFKKFLN